MERGEKEDNLVTHELIGRGEAGTVGGMGYILYICTLYHGTAFLSMEETRLTNWKFIFQSVFVVF